jgi:hypothetical protein
MEPSADVRELLDKQAIHELLLRYCRGVDRRDRALLQASFTSDAVADYGVANWSGPEIADGILSASQLLRNTQHLLGNVLVDVEGDRAYSESYFVVTATIDHRGMPFTRVRAGRYVDRIERARDGWRIAHRIVVDDWSRLDPLGERPEGTTVNAGQPAPHDPVYTIRSAAS